jgi:hypothetical protein
MTPQQQLPSGLITLTTDFGVGSPYVAQLKGVILSICPSARIVDLSHAVPPQDVFHAALVLADTAPLFPPGTLHIAVVDPGVGSERQIVYVRAGQQAYIAPDNGLLSRVIEQHETTAIIALTKCEFWCREVSFTFHGRDIMAPAAAHILCGTRPEELGRPQERLVSLPWPEVKVESHRIGGVIVQVDSFGNLISNITRRHLAAVPAGASLCVCCKGHRTTSVVDHYSQHPDGTLVAIIGSSGRLELAISGASAARTLGAGVGDALDVSW